MEIANIPFVTAVSSLAFDRPQAFRLLNDLLVEKGYTDPAYATAVADREVVFPTGLPTDPPVAIPHADPDYVHERCAAVGIFTHPIPFQEMGNPDSTLNVRLVFMLALKKKEEAVELLSELTRLFRNREDLLRLQKAKTAEQGAQVLREMLSAMHAVNRP